MLPDEDLGPEEHPRGDFSVWVQPEALDKGKGFLARGYWIFGSKMNPKIMFRIRLNGVMYRITLKPTAKESWPHRSVMDRHLLTEAARQAQDYGAPVGIGGADGSRPDLETGAEEGDNGAPED